MLARITGCLLFLLPLCALGQTGAISVRGQVLDAFTKEPLARAAIVEYGRQTGTMTGEDGFFSLNCFSDSLSIHMLGHRSKKLAVQKQPMIILLEPTSYIPLDGKNIPIVTAPGISAMYLPPSVQKGHYLGKRELRDDRLSLQPALNRIPGVYMHSGALNTNRITIRGIGNRSRFSTTKLRAFINDIPLTSGIGETTLEDIDLSLINSVGLTKGPVSSRYGAALGGTLHLSPAISDWKYKTNFQLGGQMGSYGLRRFTSQFNYVSKERKSRLSVNFNQLERDGYRDNNNYRRQIMSIMGHWRLDSRNKVSIYAHHINLDAQIPSSLNREDYDARPGAAAFVWAQIAGFEDSEKLLGGITHEHSFHPDSQAPFRLTAKTTFFGGNSDQYESRPFNILLDNNQFIGLRNQWEALLRDKDLLMAVGLEGYLEDYGFQTLETRGGQPGVQLSNGIEARSYLNLFAEATKKITSDFKAEIGLNLNQSYYNFDDFFFPDSIDQSSSSSFDPILSPRISLEYRLPYLKTNLYAHIGHGFSVPTIEETLTPEGRINRDIQPERGWTYELGGRGNINKFHLQYNVLLYSMQVRDLLVARRTGLDQFLGVNAGKTTHNGLEFSLSYFHKYLLGYLTYAYSDYRFDDFVDQDQDFSGNELTGTSPHVLNAGIGLENWKGFSANLDFQYVDAMPMRDDNSVYSEAFQLFHLKLNYLYQSNSNWSANLYIGIQNLLDEKYASMILINASSFGGRAPRYYYPGLPRNYYGGVQLTFQLGKKTQ